tara:strand:+ start:2476 stop:2856 length:381 start_codon:yes stop_codon:yes gene_type:complete
MLLSEETIFFIYNSKDDFQTIFVDTVHKKINPDTYPCQLCKLTYDTFSRKKKWQTFLKQLSYKYFFLYKDDKFVIDNQVLEFPIILFVSNNNLKVLLSKKEINQSSSLDQLITMIDVRLKEQKVVN